jgi:hypothetical protein
VEALCECGCGQPAPLSPYSDAARGYVKGQPRRFVQGHKGTRGGVPMTKDERNADARERMRKRRLECPERVRELCRQDYWRHRDKRLSERKEHRLRKTYGMAFGTYSRMAEAQNHVCAICHQSKRLVVDHCHATHVVRGLLCDRCNVLLAALENALNDADWVLAAKQYLGAERP